MSEMGKTAFAEQYIAKCRKKWPEARRNTFQAELCRCRTIIINAVSPVVAMDGMTCQDANSLVLEAVKRQLVDVSEMTMLPDPSANLVSFAVSAVELLGPLFIVLDNVDDWFSGWKGDAASSDFFHKFFKRVLQSWVEISKIYFLLSGYGRLLQSVRERSTWEHETSCRGPYKFTGLRLDLVQPDAIEAVLSNTVVQAGSSTTLDQEWGLKSIKAAAQTLFDKSAGHPRTLCQLLQTIKTHADLETVKSSKIEHTDSIDISRAIPKFRSVVLKLLTSHETIDLMETAVDDTGKATTYAQVVDRCHLGWEGSVTKAKIFVLPEVKREIASLAFPLREYISFVKDTQHLVWLDDSEALKWICLKRSQELFASRVKPAKALPAFFSKNSRFNEGNRRFSAHVRHLPKRTDDSKEISEGYLSVDTPTVLSADWPLLMQQISKLLVSAKPPDNRDFASLCFEFLPESLSPDAILMERREKIILSGNGKRKHSSNRKAKTRRKEGETLMAGLHVGNYSFSKTGLDAFENQCYQFNNLLGRFDKDTRTVLGFMTNVLILCATGISDELKSVVGENGKVAPCCCTRIHEVLLLDLSTPGQRAEFFGLNADAVENQVLLKTIEKVIA